MVFLKPDGSPITAESVSTAFKHWFGIGYSRFRAVVESRLDEMVKAELLTQDEWSNLSHMMLHSPEVAREYYVKPRVIDMANYNKILLGKIFK